MGHDHKWRVEEEGEGGSGSYPREYLEPIIHKGLHPFYAQTSSFPNATERQLMYRGRAL